jgi:hypothetical protein
LEKNKELVMIKSVDNYLGQQSTDVIKLGKKGDME